jgi:hypothetical protein
VRWPARIRRAVDWLLYKPAEEPPPDVTDLTEFHLNKLNRQAAALRARSEELEAILAAIKRGESPLRPVDDPDGDDAA